MNMTNSKMNMKYLLIINLILHFSQIVKSEDVYECGQVEVGFRDSNVCCHQDCNQCGEQDCSYSYGDNNDVWTKEGSYNCCKSYIRRNNEAVLDEPVVY